MKDMDEKTAREMLRRLEGVLGDVDDEDLPGEEEDDELPSPEEARAELARAGIDPAAALARLQARIAAFDRGAGLPAPEEHTDPAPVAGDTLPPPSTMTSADVAPHQLASLRSRRTARKWRQIGWGAAAAVGIVAGIVTFWVAVEEPELVRRRRSSAASTMGPGSSLSPPAPPALSADAPDAGTDRLRATPRRPPRR